MWCHPHESTPSKQQDLSLQCRCLAARLRAAAAYEARMMAMCHPPNRCARLLQSYLPRTSVGASAPGGAIRKG
eukprot:COSAG05_NODE_1504_length_4692_cov_2.598737_2_plen_73_part_00